MKNATSLYVYLTHQEKQDLKSTRSSKEGIEGSLQNVFKKQNTKVEIIHRLFHTCPFPERYFQQFCHSCMKH